MVGSMQFHYRCKATVEEQKCRPFQHQPSRPLCSLLLVLMAGRGSHLLAAPETCPAHTHTPGALAIGAIAEEDQSLCAQEDC